jgi:hypothetical protein
MGPGAGFEPAPTRSRAERSTAELPRNKLLLPLSCQRPNSLARAASASDSSAISSSTDSPSLLFSHLMSGLGSSQWDNLILLKAVGIQKGVRNSSSTTELYIHQQHRDDFDSSDGASVCVRMEIYFRLSKDALKTHINKRKKGVSSILLLHAAI